jgi:histidine triad (HIT) family protein
MVTSSPRVRSVKKGDTESDMKKCVFCSIVKENKPFHEIIWQDKHHLAFLDASPLRDGHILVIPKKHTDYIFDLGSKDYDKLSRATRVVAIKLKRSTHCKRVAIAVEGFSVPHVHVHMIPLNKDLYIGDQDHKPRGDPDAKHLARIGRKFRKDFRR